MNEDEEHQPERVGHDVALASFDLLARIVTREPSALARLHTLTVDHTGGRTGFMPFQLPRAQDQEVVDGLPKAAIPPRVEVALHGGPRRKILGQHPPLAAAEGPLDLLVSGGGQPGPDDRLSALGQAGCSGSPAVLPQSPR